MDQPDRLFTKPKPPAPAPRLPVLGGILIFLGVMALTAMAFVWLSGIDVTGLRGPWVGTHLSEWGTGRGGYFLNEEKADGLLLGIFAGLGLALSVLLACRRPRRRDLLHLCLVSILGFWMTLPLLGWLIQDRLTYHPGPLPAGYVPELRPDTLQGHQGQVTSVAFSPDGRLLASGGEDRTVRLWEVHRATEIARLVGHEGEVLTVAFSPDGKTVASGSLDGTLRLWDVEGRKESAVLAGHADMVRSVAFSPDGATLASGSWDKMIKLWDLKTRSEIATLAGHTDVVKGVAFSPDGKTLASGGVDAAVRIWDIAARKTVKTLQGPGVYYKQVLSVAFSPDGKWLATGGESSGVVVWSVPGYGEPCRMLQHEQVWGVAFSPDGRRLAACTEYGNAEVWTVVGGGVWVPSLTGGNQGRWVNGMAEVLFTRFKNVKGPGRIYGVALSPDGRTMATAGGTGVDGPRVLGGMQPRMPQNQPGALSLWDLK